MSHALDDIRELLRSSDEVKAVLEATVIPNSNGSEPPRAPPEVAEDRRILAVVSHKDDWDLIEEGWYVTDISLIHYCGPVQERGWKGQTNYTDLSSFQSANI